MNQEEKETIYRLSQGNPGAITVLANIKKTIPKEFYQHYLKIIDNKQIYSAKLWVLYKTICEQDILKTIQMINNIEQDPSTSVEIDGNNVEVLEYLKTIRIQ